MIGSLADYLGLLAALGIVVGVFSLATTNYLSAGSLRQITGSIPDAAIAVVGMTLVLLVGEIDLSVGSVLALSGAVLGVAMTSWRLPLAPAVGLALGVGLICGLANGLVAVAWRLPSFIVTLGMLEIARGTTYLVTRSTITIPGVEAIADAPVPLLPLPFYLALVIVGLGQLFLTRTAHGRHVVATGSNPATARLCGVNVRGVKVAVFAASGVLAALAGVMQVSRAGSASPNAGGGFELEVIAAAVVGGTSLMGGRGNVVCSLLGVLIIAALNAGLGQLGADEPVKRFANGFVIVAAAIIDFYRRRLRGDLRG